jgi:hypothetical protein
MSKFIHQNKSAVPKGQKISECGNGKNRKVKNIVQATSAHVLSDNGRRPCENGK